MGGRISGGALGAFITAIVLTLIALGADDFGVARSSCPLSFFSSSS